MEDFAHECEHEWQRLCDAEGKSSSSTVSVGVLLSQLAASKSLWITVFVLTLYVSSMLTALQALLPPFETNEEDDAETDSAAHDAEKRDVPSGGGGGVCVCPWQAHPVETLRAAALMANQLHTIVLLLFQSPLEYRKSLRGGSALDEGTTFSNTSSSSTNSNNTSSSGGGGGQTNTPFYAPSSLLPILLRSARQVFDLVQEWSLLLTTASATASSSSSWGVTGFSPSLLRVMRESIAAAPTSNAKAITTKLFGIWLKRIRQQRWMVLAPCLSASSSAPVWVLRLPREDGGTPSTTDTGREVEFARPHLIAMAHLIVEMMRAEIPMNADMESFLHAFHIAFPEETDLRCALYYEEADAMLHAVLTVEVLTRVCGLLERSLAICWLRSAALFPNGHEEASGNGGGGGRGRTTTTEEEEEENAHRACQSGELEENTRMLMLKLTAVRLALGYTCRDPPPPDAEASEKGNETPWRMVCKGHFYYDDDARGKPTTTKKRKMKQRPLWYTPESLQDVVVAMESGHLPLLDSCLARNGFFFAQTGVWNVLQFARMRLRLFMAVKFVQYCRLQHQGMVEEGENTSDSSQRPMGGEVPPTTPTSPITTTDASRIRIADLIAYYSSPAPSSVVGDGPSSSSLHAWKSSGEKEGMVLLYPTEVEAMMYWLLPLLEEKWMHGLLYLDQGYLVLSKEMPFPQFPANVLIQ